MYLCIQNTDKDNIDNGDDLKGEQNKQNKIRGP
jgi:hypothetical protein